MLEDHKSVSIGNIGNYYGGLNVKVEGGVAYWSIEDHDGSGWDDIPQNLYLELIKLKNNH